MIRSWVFRWKAARTFRIPAGDPSDGDDCECGDFLSTENGEALATEATQHLTEEG